MTKSLIMPFLEVEVSKLQARYGESHSFETRVLQDLLKVLPYWFIGSLIWVVFWLWKLG